MFKFEKLAVWQKSLNFARHVYAVSRLFPAAEQFGLTRQMRRAADSIASNIAEGCARSDPDFGRFLTYASGSLYEVVTQSFIARREQFMSEADFGQLYAEAEEIGRMLSGLRDSLSHNG